MENFLVSFVEKFKRRNAYRVAIAYVISAWPILQVGDTLAPATYLPDSINTLFSSYNAM